MRKLKILVAYSRQTTYAQAFTDYMGSLSELSGHDVSYVHVTHDAWLDFELDDFDVVFNSICALVNTKGFLSPSYREAMKGFMGLKVLAVQDEYTRTDRIREAIVDLGFTIVLTAVRPEFLEYVYPAAGFPGVRFVTVLTGYAQEGPDRRGETPALADRPIVVGYRGRNIGAQFGRLGFLKYEMGRRMQEICEARGVPHDIATDEQSRIYGEAWFDFLGKCRVALNTESGSNVFDWDGAIEAAVAEAQARLGRKPTYEEFAPLLEAREREIDMGCISPRVFEATRVGTPLVMFTGSYSGAMQRDEHYIPLATDFSNIDEVFDRIDDIPGLQAMTDRAYDHLIASGDFSYRRFVEIVMAAIREGLAALQPAPVNEPPVREANLLHPILAEQPTPHPLSSEIFTAQQQIYHAALYRAEAARLRKGAAELIELTRGVIAELPDLSGWIVESPADVVAAFAAKLHQYDDEGILQEGPLETLDVGKAKRQFEREQSKLSPLNVLVQEAGRLHQTFAQVKLTAVYGAEKSRLVVVSLELLAGLEAHVRHLESVWASELERSRAGFARGSALASLPPRFPSDSYRRIAADMKAKFEEPDTNPFPPSPAVTLEQAAALAGTMEAGMRLNGDRLKQVNDAYREFSELADALFKRLAEITLG